MTMSEDRILESVELENLTWSQEEFSLSDFVDKFPLPQIVKVQEGYYGPDEDSCLGADQILFLHALKHTDKVQARDRRKRELHIPLNCSQRVELRPSKLKAIFDNVEELAKEFANKQFPGFVRVTQGYDNDNVCINPGDKLKLIKLNADNLAVETLDGSGVILHIPLDALAGFQPLSDGREYYLKEAIDQKSLPFFFQFINPHKIDAIGEASVFNSTLGVLKAEKTYHDSTVICTTKEGTVRTVVSCPKRLQITVTAASGALIGDKEYMKVCKFFHDGVSLKKIENMECFNVFASRDTIREYVYDIPKTHKEDMPPPVPLKLPDAEEGATNDDDDDESDHDYTYIPDENITSWASQKFDYQEFRSSFEEEEEDYLEPPTQDKKDDKENLDLLAPESSNTQNSDDKEYLDILPPEPSKTPICLQEPSLPSKQKTPPPLKPKPNRHFLEQSTSNSNQKQDRKSEKQLYSGGNKKSQETILITSFKNGASQPTPSSTTTTELEQMTTREVSNFLRQHRLNEYIEVFEYNQIDGEMLASLDLEMMESLGMNCFQRKKLMKLIKGWRPKY